MPVHVASLQHDGEVVKPLGSGAVLESSKKYWEPDSLSLSASGLS